MVKEHLHLSACSVCHPVAPLPRRVLLARGYRDVVQYQMASSSKTGWGLKSIHTYTQAHARSSGAEGGVALLRRSCIFINSQSDQEGVAIA
jgi:hypothetical protein